MNTSSKSNGQTLFAYVIGLIILIAVAVLSYLFGSKAVMGESFKNHAGFPYDVEGNMELRKAYFLPIISTLIPVLAYSCAFCNAKKKEKDGIRITKPDNGQDYAYKLWYIMMIVTIIGTFIVSLAVAYFIAFRGYDSDSVDKLVQYNLLGVWLGHSIFSGIIFFFPFCKPTK